MSSRVSPLLSWLIALLVPLALIMFGVRLLLTPLFPAIEYRLPGFPEDTYGFTLEERLRWSKVAIEYLLNDAPPSFLGDLKFENGAPLYEESEVSHMLDVKLVVQKLLKVWYFDLALLALLGLWAWRSERTDALRAGLRQGGSLTIGLLMALGAFAALSFRQFFTWFHSLFFEGDSWIFRFEDTLIRLFPIRFWQDAVIFIVVFSILGGLALSFGLHPTAASQAHFSDQDNQAA